MAKKLIRAAILLLCLVLVLWLLQCLLMPKYISENQEGLLAAEYDAAAG